jgi:hypothetical protein
LSPYICCSSNVTAGGSQPRLQNSPLFSGIFEVYTLEGYAASRTVNTSVLAHNLLRNLSYTNFHGVRRREEWNDWEGELIQIESAANAERRFGMMNQASLRCVRADSGSPESQNRTPIGLRGGKPCRQSQINKMSRSLRSTRASQRKT